MKKKFFVLMIILCFLFALTSVSAGDNQTETLSDDVDYRTFSDLNKSIAESGESLNLEHDYKYDGNCDAKFKYSIPINKVKFELNGNGHVIDGNNNATLFGYARGALTFSNVTLKNSGNGFIMGGWCNITFKNVRFVSSNVSKNFFVNSYLSNMSFINCSFYSASEKFNGITSENSNIIIEDSLFSNIGGNGTVLNIDRGALTVVNTVFENSRSDYGGAINFKGHSLTVKRSKFLNSYASLTGGAILAKFFPVYVNGTISPFKDMVIEECIFANASAGHNGGAIYADLDSGSDDYVQALNISKCKFLNCSSDFGGAIANMGGDMNIINSIFADNSANQFGGAIYVTWIDLNITNSTFTDNLAKHDAAAVYFDNGYLKINHSNFTKNKVTTSLFKQAVIYAYDVCADIENSVFDNGGIAVYAVFDNNSVLSNNTSQDLFLMNNTDYIVSVENKGIKLNLTKNEIVVDNLPSRFDLRDWGWVTKVKIQGDNPSCWAFATSSAIETALLRNTGVEYDISEDNIQNLELRYFRTGDLRNNGTGFAYSGLGHSLSWFGAIMASDDPYDERGMISDVSTAESRIHLQDAMFIFGGRNDTIDLIKRAVIKYGSVTIQHHTELDGKNYYDYVDKKVQPTHFVHIVGWDDTIPAEKFAKNATGNKTIVPPGPGGWILKNAWSTQYLDNGYYYLSYYDKSFMAEDYLAKVPQNAAIVYIFENDIDYHVNYQTDLTGLVGFDETYRYYSNEFISKYDELIGAVGTYFNASGIDYSFDVFVNGKMVHSQSGRSDFAGFRTIVLNKYIPVKTGDKFKVVFKNNPVPYQEFSRQHYLEGMTFVSEDNKNWEDFTLSDRTVCLKVYTVVDDTKISANKNIAVDYAGGSYFSVKVVTSDGRAVGAGEVVKFTINGKTISVKTDNNGIAKIKITQIPKTYTIKTTYNGKTEKNTVKVNQVLTSSKVTAKKTAKKFTLKAKLKINGKLIKGKVIKFKFKGKTYKAKTNSKGIAKVTVKKNIIKKLKKGKSYTVKVTYIKDTIKTTVKIK